MAMLPEVMYAHAQRMEEQIQALRLQVEAGKEASQKSDVAKATARLRGFSSQAKDENQDVYDWKHPVPNLDEINVYFAKELERFTGKKAAK